MYIYTSDCKPRKSFSISRASTRYCLYVCVRMTVFVVFTRLNTHSSKFKKMKQEDERKKSVSENTESNLSEQSYTAMFELFRAQIISIWNDAILIHLKCVCVSVSCSRIENSKVAAALGIFKGNEQFAFKLSDFWWVMPSNFCVYVFLFVCMVFSLFVSQNHCVHLEFFGPNRSSSFEILYVWPLLSAHGSVCQTMGKIGRLLFNYTNLLSISKINFLHRN